ncbi:TetR/AcrR family transcriptional regulator C-terminal domain-containing protein [Micromonospora sp. NBC_01699]|uniref:TetR/AcrR family transcriptional regulator C-terminal domain-containing protein n=1 Tax=Micromonospora sp. NBC_01699 TaxID=2975984 RepID=UPI002E3785EC|nr:TetR/AcrR family transcriptional regulator C-terminal domain-containing protein [Micromonospora sp. NBC_01699]
MVDAVAGEYELVPPSDDWLADLVDLARQTRTITRRHPWLVPLVTGQPGIGPNSLDLVEHALALRHVAAQGRHPRLARAISRDPTGITAEQDQFELIVARTMVGILGPATDA